MNTWKEKLMDKLPKFTRKQVFMFFGIIGFILIMVFVPLNLKCGKFQCVKGSQQVKK